MQRRHFFSTKARVKIASYVLVLVNCSGPNMEAMNPVNTDFRVIDTGFCHLKYTITIIICLTRIANIKINLTSFRNRRSIY